MIAKFLALESIEQTERIIHAKMIVDTWINTEFEGGRHQRRVDLLMEIEEKN